MPPQERKVARGMSPKVIATHIHRGDFQPLLHGYKDIRSRALETKPGSSARYFQPLDDERAKPQIETAIEFYTKWFGEAPRTFLDVGSGVGHILFLAHELGLNAEGIELDSTLCEYANAIAPECLTHNMDFFEFEEFERFDLIWLFNPILDDGSKTFPFIQPRMKRPSIMIANSCQPYNDELMGIAICKKNHNYTRLYCKS